MTNVERPLTPKTTVSKKKKKKKKKKMMIQRWLLAITQFDVFKRA